MSDSKLVELSAYFKQPSKLQQLSRMPKVEEGLRLLKAFEKNTTPATRLEVIRSAEQAALEASGDEESSIG
jgi:hypothetical protein